MKPQIVTHSQQDDRLLIESIIWLESDPNDTPLTEGDHADEAKSFEDWLDSHEGKMWLESDEFKIWIEECGHA